MPWTRSLLGNLLAPYVLGTAAFAAVLYFGGSAWLALGVAAVTALAPLWLLARRLSQLTELSRAIAAGGDLRRAEGDDTVSRLESNLLAASRNFRAQLQAAREEKEKLEAVLSGMVEGVLVLDRAGDIRLSNRCAERLFGVAPGETLVGRPLISVSRDPDLRDLVREVMQAGVAGPCMREITLDAQGRGSLQVTATPLGEAGSAGQLFILVFHDLTELKRLEATRRDFVANVSHELRTPLTAIRGYAETLQSGALEDPALARRFVEVIARHSERLGRLIDDLLALSDLELGRTEIQRAPISLVSAVDAAVEVVRDKAEQRRVQLQRDIPGDTPMVLADQDRIEQLLVNLVDNAVKYTPEGGSVTVRAKVDGPPPEDAGAAPPEGGVHDWVQVSVVDTGIGIPRNELPRLTERFYRVDKARSRALGGTGLGLAIVKHIVQAHGGALRIESELGRGTAVSVYLPAAARAAA